ncbi:hypothetical protein JCM10207_004080 [Rhodosporidiobolus poonsookiae]
MADASGSNELAPAAAAASKKRPVEDDEDDGPEGTPGNKKKRNRKPVTCAQCRRRKLKCDRGYPCGACRDRQEGHLCEWEGAIRLPQPHLTRDAEAQELRNQLDRLENLLGALGNNPAALAAAAAAGVASPAAGATPPTGVAEENAAEALGLLAANPAAAAAAAAPKSAPAAHRAQLLAAAPTVSHLVTLMPPKKELDNLVTRFTTAEHVFFPIFHIPSFMPRLQAYNNPTAPDHPFLCALLFSIVAFEMGYQLSEPGMSRIAWVEKEHAAKRFFEAAYEALRMGSYMEYPDMDVVRTLLVLHRCAEQQLDNRASFMLGQAIQVGQILGLNRDPGTAEGFNPIEIEERRKLWHILLGLDRLDNSGRLSLITATQHDTTEPSNAYDTEITETGVVVKPFPTFTPWLFFHLHNQISLYSYAISEDVYAVKPNVPLTWGRIIDLNQGLEDSKRKLPVLDFAGDTVEPMADEHGASDRFRVQAHSLIFQLTIRLNRPLLTRGAVEYRFKIGRDKCIESAHKLIGIWLGYPEKHAIARLTSTTFHALNALLVCAIDLFQDPQSSNAEKHRRLIAAVSMKINAREHRPRLVTETLRIVGVFVRASAKPDRLSLTPPANLVPLPPLTTLARTFPLPMTLDPLSSRRVARPAVLEGDLSGLWDYLVAHHRGMYAVPDRREWEELTRTGVQPWAQGVDLLNVEQPNPLGRA